MHGLFESERAYMLRMSEVNAVEHQGMLHMLTEGPLTGKGLVDRLRTK